MAEVILLKLSDITKNTPMGGNVDPDKYIYCVKDVQITILEPSLGTKLYDKIKTDYAASSLTGVYEILYEDYIKPILIHSAFAEYAVIGAYLVNNKGIYKHVPEYSESVSRADIDDLAGKQRAKADVYLDRMNRFLCDKQHEIIEYTYNQDEDYDIDPTKGINTFGGWYLR